MQEIVEGLWHWTATHPRIGSEVSSYYLSDERVLGAEVHCVKTGIDELEGRGPVTPFAFGDELPGGVSARQVDSISPDETALYIPAQRALVCADGVIRSDQESELQFVPDWLMDDPEQTKAGLRAAFAKLLELDFDRRLLAHGQPILAGGKRALAAFVGG